MLISPATHPAVVNPPPVNEVSLHLPLTADGVKIKGRKEVCRRKAGREVAKIA